MLLEEDKRGILLESGTNEIEVMEFTINESLYGINVAKVKELEEKIRSGEIVVSESAVLTADQIADIVAGK